MREIVPKDAPRTGYKLTDHLGMTLNEMLWDEGTIHEAKGGLINYSVPRVRRAPGEGPLCSPAWIHLYDDPVLAILMDPIQGHYTKHLGDVGSQPRLWEVRYWGLTYDEDGTKRGATVVEAVRQLPLPALSLERRVAIALKAGLVLAGGVAPGGVAPDWSAWACRWLEGYRSLEDARGISTRIKPMFGSMRLLESGLCESVIAAEGYAVDLRSQTWFSAAGAIEHFAEYATDGDPLDLKALVNEEVRS